MAKACTVFEERVGAMGNGWGGMSACLESPPSFKEINRKYNCLFIKIGIAVKKNNIKNAHENPNLNLF